MVRNGTLRNCASLVEGKGGCLSTGARVIVVLLTFRVLAQRGWGVVYDMLSADASQPSIFAPLFFAAYSHCASHTLGGVAVSHCTTWFQTQLLFTTCQIRYHSHRGIMVALDSSEP